MPDLVSINFNPPSLGYVAPSDTYGGKSWTIYLNQEVVDAVEWVKEHRYQLAQEESLRKANPHLQQLYDEYQTLLRLIK